MRGRPVRGVKAFTPDISGTRMATSSTSFAWGDRAPSGQKKAPPCEAAPEQETEAESAQLLGAPELIQDVKSAICVGVRQLLLQPKGIRGAVPPPCRGAVPWSIKIM